ncbi:MAG: MFS transporter [Bradymonadales bacterium]|jgi:POT family proton-dependent oligopeptide transporter
MNAEAAVERKGFPQSFWVANIMEIFERMAWYGFYALSSLYIMGSVVEGGLGLTSADRGIIQGAVTFFIYLFPFVTGALGDRYGYKKMLLIAYSVLAPAYFLLGQMKTMPTFFAAFMLVGIGASIFKPLIVGTVGRVSNEKNGSLAFGIFYMMVNVGGFAGPLMATFLRSQGWHYVFYASSIWILINIPLLLIFYKEPPMPNEAENRAKSFSTIMREMFEVIGNIRFFVTLFVTLVLFVLGSKWFKLEEIALIAAIWIAANLAFDFIIKVSGAKMPRMRLGNVRFLLFLLLLSSFWVAYNQVFLTLPLFLEHSVDSRSIMQGILSIGQSLGLETGPDSTLVRVFQDSRGGVKPEHFININAFCIILFQVIVSFINSRLKPLISIMIGISITALSFILLSLGTSPVVIAFGVAVFSFGEMMASPKAKEYTAHAVAPPDKIGLYMGYFMWSNAIGSLFGGILSGHLYQRIALDANNPTLMWQLFASLSLFCCVLIFIYHQKVGKKIAAEKA